METYIYKMIALSAIFILLYFVFLEKEKNHHFKRFYLLISALFSVLVPLLSIPYGSVEVVERINQNNSELMSVPETKLVESSIFTTENIIWAIYIVGFSLLFLKFSWGIFKLIKEIKFSEKIKQDHYQFILKQNKFTPYSFWNAIFLNKSDFLEGKIDYKIILHEKAHVNQKHSIDVIFIEIMLCVFWFNPAFYFYRKAIVTNHEFLADEAVLSQNKDIISYQKLILDELISEKILFTHPFNLHNTKKRIVMMTHKLTKIAKLKSYLTLPISALLFFAFVEKVPAKIENTVNKSLQKIAKKEETQFSGSQVSNIEKSALKNEMISIKKDTIKPKKQKVEKVKEENTEMIPPPPPVKEISSQIEPEFPGGLAALRNKLAENFDVSKMKNSKGTLKGVLIIIVSEDGKSYNANYQFDDENFKTAAKDALEKTLKGVEWKPGTLNGKPVASQFKMPITMNFN